MLFIAYTLKRIVLDMDIAAILGHALIVCTLKRPVLHTYYNYMNHDLAETSAPAYGQVPHRSPSPSPGAAGANDCASLVRVSASSAAGATWAGPGATAWARHSCGALQQPKNETCLAAGPAAKWLRGSGIF